MYLIKTYELSYHSKNKHSLFKWRLLYYANKIYVFKLFKATVYYSKIKSLRRHKFIWIDRVSMFGWWFFSSSCSNVIDNSYITFYIFVSVFLALHDHIKNDVVVLSNNFRCTINCHDTVTNGNDDWMFFECVFLADDDFDYPADDTELSQRYYMMACTEMKIRPVRSIYEGLVREKLKCKGSVLLPEDVKAATIALLVV